VTLGALNQGLPFSKANKMAKERQTASNRLCALLLNRTELPIWWSLRDSNPDIFHAMVTRDAQRAGCKG
jgi:hypothetical protein